MTTVPLPGRSVCEPPFSHWAGLANANREKKYPFDAQRNAWRGEMLRLAAGYTAGLGLPLPHVAPAAPLVLSGHQPYFYHPGVLFKYRLLTRVAEQGGVAINFSVDTDLCEGFPAKIPVCEAGHYRKETLRAAPDTAKRFYADAGAAGEWLKAFSALVEQGVGTLPERTFDGGAGFLRNALAENLPTDIVSAMVVLRHRYGAGWPGNVLELPVSALCRTDGFFSFAYGLLSRADDFARIFNASLGRYRSEHKLRYKANPFPDLAEGALGVETLFWLVDGETRQTLSVRAEGGNLVLPIDGGGEAGDGASLRNMLESRGLRLWPKAVSLSAMNRLFLGDLFVHGIGGAKYDRITDEVVREFYGVEPPAFAVASATLALEGVEDPAARLSDLKQTLRECGFHPELHIENPPAGLVEKKKRLLEDMRHPGADKKTLGKELARVNGELNALLAPFKAALEGKIAAAEREQNRYEVLGDRELPYFLYPPERIKTPG